MTTIRPPEGSIVILDVSGGLELFTQPSDSANEPLKVGPLPEICVLAPWLIFTVTIEHGVHTEDEVYLHAGGQGLWVARMIANLGAQPTICGPLGGESGVVVRALIEAEGIKLRAIEAGKWNGGYVHDRRRGDRKIVAEMKSPPLNRHEQDDLYGAVLTAAFRGSVAVLTGVPQDDVVPPDFYRRLAIDLEANGVAVIADLGGPALRVLKGGLHFLKVSHEELIKAGLCTDGSEEQVRKGLLALRDSTRARNLIVSRADEPALALLNDRLVQVVAPRFDPLDHRGAGDSMTAALAVAQATNLEGEEVLRLAAAAGAMNVTRHGLGTGTCDEIQEIAKRVVICEIRDEQR
jgi:1-phosphofructokinase